MALTDLPVPDQLPVLSRGKHRNPRKGACFMELASYLAGERWSDHPACTHPLLSTVARGVNDFTSDEGRPRLAILIPSVIGLTSDDPHVDVRIALEAARAALPVVSAERQRVMAVSILACERVLDDLDGRRSGTIEEASRQALAQAPHAEQWARRFAGELRTSVRGFRRHGAPTIVARAVEGIARTAGARSDDLLHDLLVQAIDECARWSEKAGDKAETLDEAAWDDLVRLTETGRR